MVAISYVNFYKQNIYIAGANIPDHGLEKMSHPPSSVVRVLGM